MGNVPDHLNEALREHHISEFAPNGHLRDCRVNTHADGNWPCIVNCSEALYRTFKLPEGMNFAYTPIPMRLTCAGCGELHIDEGEFATKPHHTHACQRCGMVWRPALVDTVGVRFLPGFKNEK